MPSRQSLMALFLQLSMPEEPNSTRRTSIGDLYRMRPRRLLSKAGISDRPARPVNDSMARPQEADASKRGEGG